MFLNRAPRPSSSAAALAAGAVATAAGADEPLVPPTVAVNVMAAAYVVTSVLALAVSLILVVIRARHPQMLLVTGTVATWWGIRVAIGVGLLRRREWARVAAQWNFGIAVVAFVAAPFLPPPGFLEALLFEGLHFNDAIVSPATVPSLYGLVYGFGMLVLALHAGVIETFRDPLVRSEFC